MGSYSLPLQEATGSIRSSTVASIRPVHFGILAAVSLMLSGILAVTGLLVARHWAYMLAGEHLSPVTVLAARLGFAIPLFAAAVATVAALAGKLRPTGSLPSGTIFCAIATCELTGVGLVIWAWALPAMRITYELGP